MRAINARESLTDREREEFEQERLIAEMQADFQLKLKTLELDLQKQEMKWTQLFRLPFAVLMLPVRFLFGIAYITHVKKNSAPDENFWNYLRKL